MGLGFWETRWLLNYLRLFGHTHRPSVHRTTPTLSSIVSTMYPYNEGLQEVSLSCWKKVVPVGRESSTQDTVYTSPINRETLRRFVVPTVKTVFLFIRIDYPRQDRESFLVTGHRPPVSSVYFLSLKDYNPSISSFLCHFYVPQLKFDFSLDWFDSDSVSQCRERYLRRYPFYVGCQLQGVRSRDYRYRTVQSSRK